MRASAFAPAKVNLFLHVGPLSADGYHPLSSLVVFADVGDRVSVERAETASFSVEGPFANALAGEADNLVLRAVDALEAEAGRAFPPLRITLEKRLPVAAGLGGGSSDAGAALRAVRDHLGLGTPDGALERIAAGLGSDGPMCLWAKAALASGRGERLSAAPPLPELYGVLVNPGAPCPTGAVYAAYDRGKPRSADTPPPVASRTVEELVEHLALARNDLEAPAAGIAPEVGAVLETLRSAPETLLARMSGSGATCFALCRGPAEARALQQRISALRPRWWAVSTRFGDGPI